MQQPEIRSSQTENVKRAGLHESVKVINSGGSTVNGRLNIIMLGAEIERLLELGRDMDYSYNQLNIEIVTIRETLSFKEREIIDLRGRGDNSSELKNILNAKEREILLLKSNMGNEVPVANPDIENLRKRLKNLEFEVSELTRKSNAIQNEVNQILAQIGKGRQARANANNKKQNTAWCC